MPCKFRFLPFRDRVWRIQFEDGSAPAYFSEYNDEITGWTSNTPIELRVYGGHCYSLMRKLSSTGLAFYDEGCNERKTT